MAEFCYQCAIEPDLDLGDATVRAPEGRLENMLCEGCGWTYVDDNGVCQGFCANPEHVLVEVLNGTQ